MFHTIYQGSLSTRTAELFRVSIQQEMQDPPAAVSQLTFPYDEPLIIERDITEFYEPIITTTATLRVISPADRTFLPLFSVKPASVRLLVEKKTSPTVWKTYYIGTLDTDSYEEPYAYLSDYIVELNFSDLGCLHRLKCSLSGYVTLHDIINAAMKAAAIPINNINLITSTSTDVRSQNVPLTPDNILLNAANFIDEDNEPLNLYDALEAVLKPLAWKFVIHQTAICIFELHAICNLETTPTDILWMQDDQNLSVSPVYNDIIITLSPYVDTGTTDESHTAFPHKADPNVNALAETEGKIEKDTTYYTLPLTNKDLANKDFSDENRGFTIYTSDKGTGASIPGISLTYLSNAKFFKITPQGNGDEAEGVAMLYSSYGENYISSSKHGLRPSYDNDAAENIAFTFSGISIPPLTPAEKKDFVIRISLPALIDYRFNPFAEPGTTKDEEIWKQKANFIYIPVRITFTPANSTTTYSYCNFMDGTGRLNLAIALPIEKNPVTTFSYYYRGWYQSIKTSYLAYYSTSERQNTPAINGAFTENRQSINPHTATLSPSLIKADPGEHISLHTLPDDAVANGGTITISVISNRWFICTAGKLENSTDPYRDPFDWTHWVLFKLPTIEFRHRRPYEAAFPTDDIETRAIINPNAEESLEIEIIFGSQEESPLPTARSNIYFLQQTSSAATPTRIRIDTIKRADRSGTFQQLLAATIYSQYAVPHIRLTGTCQPVSPIRRYTDVSSPGIVFIPISSCEDVRAQTSEVTFAQLSPESYEKA
ncbi:MAG: hypothetical protein ACI382_00170 [Alloprevotella sp.]